MYSETINLQLSCRFASGDEQELLAAARGARPRPQAMGVGAGRTPRTTSPGSTTRPIETALRIYRTVNQIQNLVKYTFIPISSHIISVFNELYYFQKNDELVPSARPPVGRVRESERVSS